MIKFFVFVFIVYMGSCAHANIVFDVTTLKDPISSDSVISNSGEVYASRGGAKISIYETKSYKRLGSICCRKGKDSRDYFYLVGDTKESIRLIYIVVSQLGSTISSKISLYDIEANLIHSITHPDEMSHQNIAISNDGNVFSLWLGDTIQVYSSKDFSELHAFSIEYIPYVSGMSVSNKGDSIAFIAENKLYLYDNPYFQPQVGFRGEHCGIQKNKVTTGFMDGQPTWIYVIDVSGNVCISGAKKNSFIKSPRGGSDNFFYDYDDNFLLLVNYNGLYVYDANTSNNIASFLVKPHYESHFGKSKYETPFLTSQITYNPFTNIVVARGSTSTGILYKIKLSRLSAD